ncbi:hypothetical protein GWL_41710 [Herbaspirillum sp. GW103]|nr:hypothetical protein GWL_41710 [Herbaspirillum sp. GW103]
MAGLLHSSFHRPSIPPHPMFSPVSSFADFSDCFFTSSAEGK